MYLRSLDLLNFRNYERLTFNPSAELNILFGLNAQGKSAILESVYMLATSKSHRTSRDSEVIRVGHDRAKIAGYVSRVKDPDVEIELIISRSENKHIRINEGRHKRIADLIGQLSAVIFSTLDIEMIRGEPALRRRFLNLAICQISPRYVFALSRYNKAVEQRNALLRTIRDGNASIASLDGWDSQLTDYGSIIVEKRAEFCNKLSFSASESYKFLADSAEDLQIDYKAPIENVSGQSLDLIAEILKQRLMERREVDVARGITTVGPHRDDIEIVVSGLPAREFASQGQQRCAALAIKLAEIDVVREQRGEEPVVLLDDAAAELDEFRRNRMIQRIAGRGQIFFTTTNPEEVDSSLLSSAAVFEVGGGKVNRL